MRLEYILISGVVNLIYSYFAVKNYEKELKWHRYWAGSETAQLPILQRISPILFCVLLNIFVSALWWFLIPFITSLTLDLSGGSFVPSALRICYAGIL